jgi:uncharacterized protein YjbI with pentapeptide repeats
MNGYSFNKVLLPALLVSSSVFSFLTVPFTLLESEPFVIDIPPFSAKMNPIFEQENKDFAIRYVGCSIIVSVTAGIVTAELLRKRQSSKSSTPTADPVPAPLIVESNSAALEKYEGLQPQHETSQFQDFAFESMQETSEMGGFSPEAETIQQLLESSPAKTIQFLDRYRNGEKDFSGAMLKGINLSGMDLKGVNFENADLSGADLRGADLRGGNLSKADLWGANLSYADLTGAKLPQANLWGANLTRATLNAVDLTDVNLQDADLTDTVFADADGVDQRSLQEFIGG